LALALLAPHPLLLMDEPFDGFDLRQTREIMNVLRDVASNGRTLVLAIHQLGDAARVCDCFVLLADGRVRGVGTLAELRVQTGKPAAGLDEVFLALTCPSRRPARSVPSLARQGDARGCERPRAVDHAADPVPARGLQLFPGGRALRRGELRRAGLASAGERPLPV